MISFSEVILEEVEALEETEEFYITRSILLVDLEAAFYRSLIFYE